MDPSANHVERAIASGKSPLDTRMKSTAGQVARTRVRPLVGPASAGQCAAREHQPPEGGPTTKAAPQWS
jgi:hypothetical protein